MAFRWLMVVLAQGVISGVALFQTARAEIVLDDFDDVAQVIAPTMNNQFVINQDVGLLHAERRIRIATAAAIPIASFDANFTSSSVLTANVDHLDPHPVPGPLFAFQFNYEFSPTDMSADDAILFDFRSIDGDEGPAFLRVILADNTNMAETYEARITNLPLIGGPFTAAMDFSSFTQRGGSPGLPDFTTVKRMEFDFFFQFPSNDVRWSAELERIRIGSIPESASGWLFLCGMMSLAIYGNRGPSFIAWRAQGHDAPSSFCNSCERVVHLSNQSNCCHHGVQ